jgi:hypothetical protein
LLAILKEYRQLRKSKDSFKNILSRAEVKFGPEVKELLKSLEITGAYLKEDLIDDMIERAALEDEVADLFAVVSDSDFHLEELNCARMFDEVVFSGISQEELNRYLSVELKFLGKEVDEEGKETPVQSKFGYEKLSQKQRDKFEKRIKIMQEQPPDKLIPPKEIAKIEQLYHDAEKDFKSKFAVLEKGSEEEKEKAKKLREDIFSLVIQSLETKGLSSEFLKLYINRMKYFIETRRKFEDKNSELAQMTPSPLEK